MLLVMVNLVTDKSLTVCRVQAAPTQYRVVTDLSVGLEIHQFVNVHRLCLK